MGAGRGRARPRPARSARRPGAPRPLPLLRPRRPLGTLGESRPPSWSASRRRGAVQGARRGREAGPRLFTSGRAAASRGPVGMCGSSQRPIQQRGLAPPPDPRPAPFDGRHGRGPRRWGRARGWGAGWRAQRRGRESAAARRLARAKRSWQLWVKRRRQPGAPRSSAAGFGAAPCCAAAADGGGMGAAWGSYAALTACVPKAASGLGMEDGAMP